MNPSRAEDSIGNLTPTAAVRDARSTLQWPKFQWEATHADGRKEEARHDGRPRTGRYRRETGFPRNDGTDESKPRQEKEPRPASSFTIGSGVSSKDLQILHAASLATMIGCRSAHLVQLPSTSLAKPEPPTRFFGGAVSLAR